MSEDHPRIRGEHDRLGRLRDQPLGSSPHTRGARIRLRGPADGLRIIPAYAGSTGGKERTNECITDHPRIRGEHDAARIQRPRVEGSSPHTRGAPRPPEGARPWLGIIPAYAGSTSEMGAVGSIFPDHPRIRGEHGFQGFDEEHRGGSSPHTRGAPDRTAGLGCRRRIIPAYAGSTRAAAGTGIGRWDHPRIRGEHDYAKRAHAGLKGSSPHTRGARPAAG